ncbi:MAG: alpha/beta fold hydrolase [Leucobacter sp.]
MTILFKRFQTSVLGSPVSAWQYGTPDGTPLILVHGFRGDHHGLDLLAAGLATKAPELRIIVPDLPGFGETPPVPERDHDLELYGEWLGEFADHIAGANSFAILGHSFGSLIVSRALAGGMKPTATILINPISSLALSGPNRVMTQLAIAYYQLADVLPDRFAHKLLTHPGIVRVMSETMAKTADPELRSWIHGQHSSHFSKFSDPRTLLQAFRASVSHTVAEVAESFSMPTLLVAGDRDDITPLQHQLSLHRRIAGSRLNILPGVGHLVHYEAVDDSVAYTLQFLQDVTLKHDAGDALPATQAGERDA